MVDAVGYGRLCEDVLHVLKNDKSLITIFERKLWMHSLLQEMGQEIIRRKSFEAPGRRNRLWLRDDVLHVLKNNTISGLVYIYIYTHTNLERIIYLCKIYINFCKLFHRAC